MTTATKFGAWTTPQSELEIEYSLVVLEEIRRSVTDGFQRLRGGMEVGGILYGTRDQSKLRIEAIRDITCEHAHGPSFHLSDKDHQALDQQLLTDQDDPRLKGYVVLGWFVSHPRKDIALQPSDVELYDRYFPGTWQITLVIRPGRAGMMRAGFFVRDADGHVKTDRSYQDFNFPELAPGTIPAMLNSAVINLAAATPAAANPGPKALAPRPAEVRGRREAADGDGVRPRGLDSSRTPIPATDHAYVQPGLQPDFAHDFQPDFRGVAAPAPMNSAAHSASSVSLESAPSNLVPSASPYLPAERADAGQRSFGEPPPDRGRSSSRAGALRTVTLAVAAALAGALASFAGLRGLPDHKNVEPISLAMFDHAGQLQIQWNHSAGALSAAKNGSIEIEDGGSKQTFSLTAQDLAQGSYTYVRKTGDVQVRMQVADEHGQQKQEASRFLGAAATPSDAIPAVSAPVKASNPGENNAAVSVDLDAALEESARQKTRIQQLERTIVILQGRLGVNQDK